MFQHILVPTDGGALSERATQTAIDLARLSGARLTVLAVTDPFPFSPLAETAPIDPQEYLDAQRRMAERRVQAVQQRAQHAGLRCEGVYVEAAAPWRGITEQAQALGADLIVMASHGRRGVEALLLGSETQRVLTHCAVPVLVVR